MLFRKMSQNRKKEKKNFYLNDFDFFLILHSSVSLVAKYESIYSYLYSNLDTATLSNLAIKRENRYWQ